MNLSIRDWRSVRSKVIQDLTDMVRGISDEVFVNADLCHWINDTNSPTLKHLRYTLSREWQAAANMRIIRKLVEKKKVMEMITNV